MEATEAQRVQVPNIGHPAEWGLWPSPVFLYSPRSCLSILTCPIRQGFRKAPEFSMTFDPVITRLQTSLKKIIMKADKMYLQGCSVTLLQEQLGCGEICCVLCSVAQLCLTLCDPMDCNPPGSSIHGILQARTLEWVAMPSSRGSSRPGDRTQVSWIAGRFFTSWATRKAQGEIWYWLNKVLGWPKSLFWFFCTILWKTQTFQPTQYFIYYFTYPYERIYYLFIHTVEYGIVITSLG